MAQRAGRIAAAGGQRAVSFEAAPEDLNEVIDAAYRQKYAGNPYLSRLRHHYRDAPDLPDIEPDAEAPETPTPEAR
jgi:hypothetical protein